MRPNGGHQPDPRATSGAPRSDVGGATSPVEDPTTGPVPIIDSSPLYSLCFRITYRLTGSKIRARSFTYSAIEQAQKTPLLATATATAVACAVQSVIDWRGSGDRDSASPNDPHLAHRLRLLRDLARWPATQRAMLALRALGALSLEATAESVGMSPAAVAETTRMWMPEDDEHQGLLVNLDQWMGESPTSSPFRPPSPFEHLDDDVSPERVARS